MSGRKLVLFLALIVFFLSAFVGPVNATTTPSFPSCTNPQGQLKSSYPSGIHGVAGDSNTYTGSDSVYALSQNTLTQCLCTSSGAGIQTNWWKVSELSQEEESILVNQGWILIPDGSAWGLDQGPYLTKNSSYSCSGGGNSGGAGDGLSDGKSDGKVGGASASISESILSLANTGNILFIIAVFSIGILLFGSGLIFSFKNKK